MHGVGLSVGQGEVAALIGPNAAGKTTMLRPLVGLKDCTSGVIRFEAHQIHEPSTPDRVRLGIVLVPEGRQIFAKFSVLENLRMGAFQRADRDRLDADFQAIFELFPKLAERRNQRAGLMSGGEQQILAIGRGLMAKPRLLLLDEPTLGLAPIIVEEIELAIGRLAGRGMTILIAEPNAALAVRMAQRLYGLESGRISLQGPPQCPT